MSKKRRYSQINNFNTYCMYKRQLLTLAENVFIYKNIPDLIDVGFINQKCVRSGSVVWYYEDLFDSVIALPYSTIDTLDIYGRPTTIQAIGDNGYRSKILKPDEYVIMYDNFSKKPIWLDLEQYAERLALITRVIDINIFQQKTPRIYQVPAEMKRSLEDLSSDIDAGVETILTYDSLNIDSINTILSPAPYVADKLREEFNKQWSDALSLIGITNVSIQKKERLIKDEMSALNGGTIANRYNRFESRLKAVKEINEKFGNYLEAPIEVEFYDKIPDSENVDIPDLDDFQSEDIGGEKDVLQLSW